MLITQVPASPRYIPEIGTKCKELLRHSPVYIPKISLECPVGVTAIDSYYPLHTGNLSEV